ncbi:MAG: methionyl-tRNA formyltransferase [Chromatiales bacterium]|jgi:methionyl-tRNA formyltransferase
MADELDIVFAGTPDFAVPSLRALIGSAHRVLAVYTQPDRPAGRGRKLAPSPVKRLAQDHGIEVRQPTSLKPAADCSDLEALGADLMVVAAYGLLLPRRVLGAPRLGCVNVHASLLPRWRGAAPIQRAILAGDPESGVSIMQMEAGLDTGPVLLERSCPIGPRDTAGDLHDRLSELGARALTDALPGIADGSLSARPQDDELATYATKLSKEEAWIDWALPAVQIDRQVRAFNPWPVACTDWGGRTLRIWRAEPLAGSVTATPGTVIGCSRDGIDCAAGEGAVRIVELQAPGKRAMAAADFLNAHDLTGVVFG